MSAPPPRTASPAPTVPPVPMPTGRVSTQGMIAAANPFVDSQGVLSGVSFRFLFGVFNQINQLQMEVETLQQRLEAANIP
jgi:hypothetical protein